MLPRSISGLHKTLIELDLLLDHRPGGGDDRGALALGRYVPALQEEGVKEYLI